MNNKTKISANEMTPGDIFHPGIYIKDEIDYRGFSQQELSDKLNISKSEMSLIINGRRNITPVLALKLEKILEISAEFWMNLQVKYEIAFLKRKSREKIISPKNLSSTFHVQPFV